METLAIIVPCYNEQEALPLFYKEASKVLEKLNYDYKLLLINDGSKDNTLSIMKSIAKKDEHVKYLSFSSFFVIPSRFATYLLILRSINATRRERLTSSTLSRASS